MGEQFGHYEILRRLAAGGMAEVLLAKQRSVGGFERLVCLKRILPHLSKQEDFLKMFQDEARIAANLIHPNIAQIYDIAAHDGRYFIAMEYVRGEDLRRIYNQEVGRGSAIARPIAAQVAMGAAAALDYAHRQQSLDGQPLDIVHRDINPQNILVTYDGFVKLIDFGVAKAAGKLMQTRSGVLKGKYSYMSPEQASGDPVDGRTDIFALGVTLYEITTGVRLFKRENELETLHAVIACNVTPPRELIGAYEPGLQAIIMKALAYDPDDRYHTAGEMQADLERFLQEAGHPTSAGALATFMHDTFAEKLAEEAVSGPSAAGEAATHSRGVAAQRRRRQPPAVVAAAPPATPGDWEVDEASLEKTLSEPSPEPQAPGPAPAAAPPPHTTRPMPLPPASRRPARMRRAVAAMGLALLLALAVVRAQRRAAPAPPAAGAASARMALPEGAEAPMPAPRNAESTSQTSVEPATAASPRGPALQAVAPLPIALSLAGRPLGITPLLREFKKPGLYRLQGQNTAYGLSLTRQVRILAHSVTQLDLGKPAARLVVRAEPAWAWVQLGSQPGERTPLERTLPAGSYQLTLECAGGEQHRRRIMLPANQQTVLDLTCPTAQLNAAP